MIKIGTPKGTRLNYKGNEVVENYTYSDAKCDEDGWVDAKNFMPMDFDLCQLKVKDKKIRVGWNCGSIWDGLKVAHDEEVLYWKKSKE